MSGGIEVDRSNTILYCTNWSQTVDFYRTMLGFQVTYENDWFVEFAVGDGSHLSIADAKRATIAPADGAGITLSWRVPDLDRAHRTLLERGAATGCDPRTMGSGRPPPPRPGGAPHRALVHTAR